MNIIEDLKNAICNNDINFLEQHKNSYNINERLVDEDNDTLLMYSISDSKSNVYEFFLRNNADVNLTNDEGENIIHAIIYSGDIKRLCYVMENYKININHQSNDGATPLLLAISLENNEIVNTLIEYGSNVNLSDIEGLAPLHLAAQLSDLNIIKKLVTKGADLFTKTKRGNLPLALAVNRNEIDIIKYLYETMYSSTH